MFDDESHKLLDELLSPDYKESAETESILDIITECDVVVSSREDWAKRMIKIGERFAVTLMSHPSPSATWVMTYRRHTGQLHKSWRKEDNFTIDGNHIVIPCLDEFDRVIVRYNRETWEDMARRRWHA